MLPAPYSTKKNLQNKFSIKEERSQCQSPVYQDHITKTINYKNIILLNMLQRYISIGLIHKVFTSWCNWEMRVTNT